jgi:hypothetical protein
LEHEVVADELESGFYLLDQQERLLYVPAAASLSESGHCTLDLRAPLTPFEYVALILRHDSLFGDRRLTQAALAYIELREGPKH